VADRIVRRFAADTEKMSDAGIVAPTSERGTMRVHTSVVSKSFQ
jgi:hypothetical protein